jgi:hypothetical protein
MGQREDLLPRDRRAEPGPLVLRVPAQRDRAPRQHDRRDVGLGGEPAAHRLGDEHDLGQAHAQAAVLFGKRNGRPAELGHPGEAVERIAALVARVPELAQARHRRAARDEFVRGARQQGLVLGQYELHGRS